MLKPIHILPLLPLFLGACSSKATDEPAPAPPDPVEEPQHAMSFSPSADPQSRAATPLEESFLLFNVWTYKHPSPSSSVTVMPGYNVKHLGASDKWQYDGTAFDDAELSGQYLKFWDGSAQCYDFLAYAPFDASNVEVTADDTDYAIKFTGHTTYDGSDLVLAHQKRHINDEATLRDEDALASQSNEQQPAFFYDKVPLVFHHILSKVELRIYNSGDTPAYLENIKMYFDNPSIYQSGSYSLSSGFEPDPDPDGATSLLLMHLYGSGTSGLKLDPVITDYKSESSSLGVFAELPGSGADLLNVVMLVNGTEMVGKFPILDPWAMDKIYIYYINIKIEEGKSPILVDITTDIFEHGDWDQDDTETNW